MTQPAPRRKQRGAALWMLLIAVIMAGGFAFYRTSNFQFNRVQQDSKLAMNMAQAKDALIARAVTDSNRPGSLPCPDLMTNDAGLHNVPYDGKADNFIGAASAQCPSYVGWLPWVTLDLPDLADGTGTRLWYVLAPALRDDDSAHPINSDTLMDLQVDGNINIAALIIAPGSQLSGQNRPSNNSADYLDGENGNGNDNKYITGPPSATFNDVVLVVTRQELMAAVEKRVANELKSCLEQHAASTANTDHRYPWPAPLATASFQGKSGSYFGRVPTTQPSSGQEAALKASIAKITQAQTQIATAPNASQQLTALQGLSDTLIEARNLFDSIFTVANKIKQTADDVANKLQGIENSITAAGTRISRSEGTTIRGLANATDTTLDALPAQLLESGMDVFPIELARRSSTLASAVSASDLVTSTQAIKALLLATTTARVDISPSLITATNAANTANAAAIVANQPPNDAALLNTARAEANALLVATASLSSNVEASRVNVLASEVSSYVSELDRLNTALRSTTNPENTAALLAALNATKKSVEAITTGIPGIVTAKTASTTALTTASTTALANSPNYSVIDANTTAAISNITALASAIAGNEIVDNNLSHTSLIANTLIYKSARTTFSQVDTATPRPLQSDITPYAQSLGSAAVNVDIWAKSISDNVATLAPLAKAIPVASNIDPASASILDTSAYKIAGNALTSITGKNESSELLQAYINTSSSANQAKAITALGETTVLVNALLSQANILDNSLASTNATATPIIWLSSRCDFLLESAPGWWKYNQWANSVFYQFGAPLQATPGKLTVNGAGNYRLVALVAGKAFATQNRAVLAVANFLEGSNADSSRDGLAGAPTINFISQPPSSTFNDRLAY